MPKTKTPCSGTSASSQRVDKKMQPIKPAEQEVKVAVALNPIPTLPSACTDSLLNIWRKRVHVGDKVFVSLTSDIGNIQREGVVEEISFEQCFAVINIENNGFFHVPLKSVQYVEVLCPPDLNKRRSVDNVPSETFPCSQAILNIWKRFKVGDVVFVHQSAAGGSFIATIAEINWKYCFAGLQTASGISYLPLSSASFIDLLCKFSCGYNRS